MNTEITKLERRLRNYEKQERQLIMLLRHSEVTHDYVLDEVNRLNKERQADGEELHKLKETKSRLTYLADAEINLSEFCHRVRQNLNNATIQDKRLALDALDIRITASKQSIDIKGSIPMEIASAPMSSDVTTIEQTSGCLFRCRYIYTTDKGYALVRA